MKCQNCGKNEVSFIYTSNVNGKITRRQLCAECAQKLGYADSLGSMFARSERMMNQMMDGFFGRSLMPFASLGLPMSEFMGLPGWEETAKQEESCTDCGAVEQEPAQESPEASADGEISRRRQMNALRHKMHVAAAREDYEAAAKYRDELRRLEG